MARNSRGSEKLFCFGWQTNSPNKSINGRRRTGAPLTPTLGLAMQEHEFISSIDCSFPYKAPVEWRRIVVRAPRISSNAALMVVYELCRPPRSVDLPKEKTRLILEHLYRHFRHPLKSVLGRAIEAHITGKELSVEKAGHLMRKVAAYPGQYNVLSICYSSANDKQGKLDELYDQITESWAKA